MADLLSVDPTCPLVKNLLLLDSEGKRIAVKYFSSEWWVPLAHLQRPVPACWTSREDALLQLGSQVPAWPVGHGTHNMQGRLVV